MLQAVNVLKLWTS